MDNIIAVVTYLVPPLLLINVSDCKTNDVSHTILCRSTIYTPESHPHIVIIVCVCFLCLGFIHI